MVSEHEAALFGSVSMEVNVNEQVLVDLAVVHYTVLRGPNSRLLHLVQVKTQKESTLLGSI